jgi:hypothetical protein
MHMFGAMSVAWVLVWLARAPCMPVELGLLPPPPPPVSSPPLPPPLPSAAAPVPLPPVPLPPPPARVTARLPLPPPLAARESARYRVDYGVLTGIGEIRLSIDGPHADRGDGPHADRGDGPRAGGGDGPLADAGERLVRAGGYGEGAILGFGRTENRVQADFDPWRLDSRRWTSAKRKGGHSVHDAAEQRRQGQLDLVRQRDDAAPERRHAVVPGPALDPVGFLLRLRVAPPPSGGAPQVLQVLDGQELWRVTLVNARRERLERPRPRGRASSIRALRLEATVDPIRYDGGADDAARPHRAFVLWLADDPSHLPLRLEMPMGIGDVVVQLVQVERG